MGKRRYEGKRRMKTCLIFLKNFWLATLIVGTVLGTVFLIIKAIEFLFVTFGLYALYGFIPLVFIIIIAITLTEDEIL